MRSLLGCEVRTSRSLRRGGGHPKTLRLTSGPNSSGVVNRVRTHAGDPAISCSNCLSPLFNDYSALAAPSGPVWPLCQRFFPSPLRWLGCNASLRNSETRLQKVGSLRCAFLASPLVHGLQGIGHPSTYSAGTKRRYTPVYERRSAWKKKCVVTSSRPSS